MTFRKMGFISHVIIMVGFLPQLELYSCIMCTLQWQLLLAAAKTGNIFAATKQLTEFAATRLFGWGFKKTE